MASDGIRRRYRPCSTCPFLKGGKGLRHLGKDRADEIKDNLLDDKAFTCHNDNDVAAGYRAQCAGAMLILQKLGRSNLPMRMIKHWNLMDLDRLRGSSEVFDNFDDWVEVQAK